jgi:hypothetical protein
MMRTPRQYIASALAKLSRTLPAVEMRCGGDVGDVVQTSSLEDVESVAEDSPNEAARYLAPASSFPTLAKGSFVEIGNTYRLVTSLKTDLVGASKNFGASKPFDDLVSTYSGKRREDGKVRQIKNPIQILALLTSTADEYSDVAISAEETWSVCIAESSWLELTEPQIGDTLEFIHPNKEYETVTLKVSAVTKHNGWWIIKARTRGGS